MNWSKEKEASASRSESNSGSWCVFVSLSDTEGVKFYHTPKMRDEAAGLQEYAASIGLAPRVGAFCEMPFLESWEVPYYVDITPGQTVYGYITEKADCDGDPLNEEEWGALTEWLREYGIPTKDCCSFMNTGILNGWPVRIDFDPMHY